MLLDRGPQRLNRAPDKRTERGKTTMQVTKTRWKDTTDNPPKHRTPGDRAIPVRGFRTGFVDVKKQRTTGEENS